MAVQIVEEFSYVRGHTVISFDRTSRECSKAAILTALCFKASVKTHFSHLKTSSYSEHKAFDHFYKEIVELGDNFAETYQGRFGKIDEYPWIRLDTHCGKHVIETLAQWIEDNRRYFDDELDLQTIISDVLALCNKTIYKLENLK